MFFYSDYEIRFKYPPDFCFDKKSFQKNKNLWFWDSVNCNKTDEEYAKGSRISLLKSDNQNFNFNLLIDNFHNDAEYPLKKYKIKKNENGIEYLYTIKLNKKNPTQRLFIFYTITKEYLYSITLGCFNYKNYTYYKSLFDKIINSVEVVNNPRSTINDYSLPGE
jgi:hypothetical protein